MKQFWVGMMVAWLCAGGVAAAQDADAPASLFPGIVLGKLTSLNEVGGLHPFDAEGLAPAVQYYAVYYSAQWCPPCHAFTPELVKFYNEFKPTHANFELIFVSDDNSPAEMLAYMREMAMPWPALTYAAAKASRATGSGMRQWVGRGIPDLVLIDASGKVLSNSYVAGTYVGPQQVVEDIRKLVPEAVPQPQP